MSETPTWMRAFELALTGSAAAVVEQQVDADDVVKNAEHVADAAEHLLKLREEGRSKGQPKAGSISGPLKGAVLRALTTVVNVKSWRRLPFGTNPGGEVLTFDRLVGQEIHFTNGTHVDIWGLDDFAVPTPEEA